MVVKKKNQYLIYWSHGKQEGNTNYDTNKNFLNEEDLQLMRELVAEYVAETHGIQASVTAVIIKNIMKM